MYPVSGAETDDCRWDFRSLNQGRMLASTAEQSWLLAVPWVRYGGELTGLINGTASFMRPTTISGKFRKAARNTETYNDVIERQ